MKKVLSLLALAVFTSCMAFAQAPKLGYISSADLLQTMPEIVKADADLKAYAKTFQDQLESMNTEAQKKYADYQANDKTMTDAVREVRQKELQDLQARMESTQQSAQEKVSKKKEDLYKPLLEKADKAIKDVAKEKGYDYVFDSSAGQLLFAKDSDNILPLVKAKLGIK